MTSPPPNVRRRAEIDITVMRTRHVSPPAATSEGAVLEDGSMVHLEKYQMGHAQEAVGSGPVVQTAVREAPGQHPGTARAHFWASVLSNHWVS